MANFLKTYGSDQGLSRLMDSLERLEARVREVESLVESLQTSLTALTTNFNTHTGEAVPPAHTP